MLLRVRCTGCGKAIIAVAQDAGSKLLCRACGTWITMPQPGSADAQLAAQNEPAIDLLGEDLEDDQSLHLNDLGSLDAHNGVDRDRVDERPLASPADATEWSSADQQPERPAPGVTPAHLSDRQRQLDRREMEVAKLRARFVWAMAIVGGVCIVGAIIAIVLVARPDPWERQNRGQLLSLKAEAEGLVREGKFAEAHATYQRLQEFVGGRTLKDSALKDEVDRARDAQDRLLLVLLEKAREQRPTQPPRPGDEVPIIAPATQPSPTPGNGAPLLARVDPPSITPETPSIKTVPLTPPVTVVPPPSSRRPPIRPIPMPVGSISDEEIGQAISRGVDILLLQFEDGQLNRVNVTSNYAGMNALAVYTLLQCGQAIPDQRLNIRTRPMRTMIEKMRDMPINSSAETYTRAIRATALAVYNRPEDRAALKADVDWLIKASRDGAYTYSDSFSSLPSNFIWDNSNSQYGLLGVWSGAEAGIEVPQEYWQQVQEHWSSCQTPNGQWHYKTSTSTGTASMTMAGLASLFVTHDYLEAPQFGNKVGREPFSPALARGLAWIESGDNSVNVRSGGWPGYTLYGLERVGLASGFKFFGAHDWYRELAADVIARQSPHGNVGQLLETCYSMLFLARGRHPILMNKLRFNGCWANRPRDLANLARFTGRELERPLNWQVISLSRDWTEWMDSPIVYLASHEPIRLSDDHYGKLRQFIEAGGMIYTQADGNSASFNKWVNELAARLLPNLEWTDLPLNHELYTMNFKVEPKPKLRQITNGSRILMLHSPEDLAQHWQLRAEKTRRYAFELGANIFIYAAGKSDLRNRLTSTYLPPLRSDQDFRIRLARVKYPGLWDPEPHSFVRFSRWFTYQTGYALDVRAVDAADLKPETYPIAHLTGTMPHAFSGATIDALKKYVEDGGVLLIDGCGGAWQFNESVTTSLIPKAFPPGKLSTMPAYHPILEASAPGMDQMPKLVLRQYAETKMGRSAGHFQMLTFGKGIVIYSPMDLTTALLGTNTWGILGYRPAYAQSFLKNLVLWVADGAPKPQPP